MTNPITPVSAEIGSGNVFADLGRPDAEDMLLKAQVVTVLRRLIKARDMTQTAAARLVGISQPDLSHILRGNFRGWSADRLMWMLTAFEQDVEITIRPHAKAGEPGAITFTVAVGIA